MIRPHATERDWFVVDPAEVALLAAAPGLTPRRGQVTAHRSLLALLADDVAAQRLLTPRPVDVAARERLDARTNVGAGAFLLRAHQHAAREYILGRRGTLLADEMRTGKTCSALSAHDSSLGRLVVICPLMVRQVWLDWIARFFPGEEVGVLMGRTFDRAVASRPIVVGHYDILHGWESDVRSGTLIFDEAHLLSNARTLRTNAAALMGDRAQRVVALTGTPVWNMPISAHPVLQLVAPGAFGNRRDFGQRYCAPEATAHGTVYKGSSNQDELRLRLSEVMLRRLHRDVAKDLPEVSRDVLIVDLSQRERNRIDIAAEMLRQPGTRTNTIGAMARYRSVLADVKVDAAVAHASEVAKVEPIVVWTWHRRVAEMVAGRLEGAQLLTGDVAPAEREARLRAWRAQPRGVLVATISVGQVGIDLSHARRELFVEVDYTPAVVAQAEMRTYSPARPMYVSFLVADHVADRRVVNALVKKLAASAPLGVDAAAESIDILREILSPAVETADLERLARDLINTSFQ